MGQALLDIENIIGSIGHAGASAPVTIGNLVLTGIEVPDQLQIGGRQMLQVHRLPGGSRVVDALGNDPGRLELRGRFFGPDAQSRAQEIERLRMAGAQIPFFAAGLTLQVWIAEFIYTYEAKGALCSYRLILEQSAQQVASVLGASLTDLIGADTGNALKNFSAVVDDISENAFTTVGQLGTIFGQLTPLSTMLGAGGTVAKVMNALGVANGLTQAGNNIGKTIDSLKTVATTLNTVVAQSSANIDGITLTDVGSLEAAVGNAGLMSAAVDAKALAARAQTRASTVGTISG